MTRSVSAEVGSDLELDCVVLGASNRQSIRSLCLRLEIVLKIINCVLISAVSPAFRALNDIAELIYLLMPIFSLSPWSLVV